MRLSWRIYICFFVSALLTLAATVWYANRSLRRFHEKQVAADLLIKAEVLAHELRDSPLDRDPAQADRQCKAFGRLTQTRVTVILPDGRVIGDSDHDPAGMENHRDRPEIIQAMAGQTGQSLRFSDTIRRTLLYMAIPLRRDDAVVAVVRASLPLSVVDWTVGVAYRQVLLGALISAAIFAVVAFYLARRISRPLEDMQGVAERLAQGDFSARVPLLRGGDMRALGNTFNRMADQLRERMETVTRQSNEQKAVFASMIEGVLAADCDGRILHLNSAAARLLDVDPDRVRGRSVQEAVRNTDFLQFVTHTLSAEQTSETEIVVFGNEERHLQLHGTALADPAGAKIGALIVLHDITRLKRLETVRRDFVANASHELKTPITALKGCVEMLSDQAPRDPRDEQRFVAMMGRQVERLNAIVEDLLSLSRIEHDAEWKRIPLERAPVGDILRRAAQVFARAADEKHISLTVDCPDPLAAPVHAALLEQAVGNLIDNAIKYSSEGTRVVVSGTQSGDDVEIRVTDEGPGIEKKHLSRVFERFYRVDHARSRALGGTGLGLAIVKHIALAHGGSVSVESTPGRGSVFFVRIPGRQAHTS